MHATRKKVCAIVVTYNRPDSLKEVIKALESQTYPLSNIIVVDNNSDQPTINYLESIQNQITYIKLNENLGGAGGFNKGIRTFIENTDDNYVWIMDDDVVPNNDALEKLMDYESQNSNFSFLASDVRWTDGSRAIMNRPGSMNILKEFPDDLTEPTEIRSATFVSLLMPAEIIEEIGLPISDFFIWGDDVEYTLRAQKKAPGYFVPSSKVTHKMAQNVGPKIKDDSIDRVPRYFYSFRNGRYYFKNRRPKYIYLMYIIKYYKDYLDLKLSNVDNKRERLEVMSRGYREGKDYDPEIEYAKRS